MNNLKNTSTTLINLKRNTFNKSTKTQTKKFNLILLTDYI